MPEIAGDAGLLVNPDVPEEIFHKMQLLELNPGITKVITKKALSHSQLFSWRIMAVSVLEVYTGVLDKSTVPVLMEQKTEKSWKKELEEIS